MQCNTPSSSETPLTGLLPVRLIRILAKNDIVSVEAVRRAYPVALLKLSGIGLERFRRIEMVFFPGHFFEPKFAAPPIQFARDSSLNDKLPLVTVRALAREGIKTSEQLREAYPNKLLQIRSIGPGTLKEIERVFFPEAKHDL